MALQRHGCVFTRAYELTTPTLCRHVNTYTDEVMKRLKGHVVERAYEVTTRTLHGYCGTYTKLGILHMVEPWLRLLLSH